MHSRLFAGFAGRICQRHLGKFCAICGVLADRCSPSVPPSWRAGRSRWVAASGHDVHLGTGFGQGIASTPRKGRSCPQCSLHAEAALSSRALSRHGQHYWNTSRRPASAHARSRCLNDPGAFRPERVLYPRPGQGNRCSTRYVSTPHRASSVGIDERCASTSFCVRNPTLGRWPASTEQQAAQDRSWNGR